MTTIDIKKTALYESAQRPVHMNPKKFAFWIFLVTVVMLFASFTSAYLVRRDAGGWLHFKMPAIFAVSTFVLLVSSAFMHWAYISAKKDNFGKLKIAIAITTLLGIAFLVLQVMGWGALVEQKIFFAGKYANPAGSFVYVFSSIHGLHLISGIIFLLVVFANVYKMKIHSKNMLQMELCTTYWHFLDLLWVYLYVFLLVNN
ncbi:MAG: cytochrome c oxidase subunit 3 [Cytophagaceae bacterium]|nr:cytochrome c oxidase subunit 3 [Cytophagaceae bacterium]MDW8455625.1 cytochrome c oxidase subunit 3 [Cytophagaceae bacterium]